MATPTTPTVEAAHDLRDAALVLAHAINRRTRLIIGALLLIIVGGSVLFGIGYAQQGNTLRFAKRGIGCMLEQQAEHRYTNYDSHVQIAEGEGKALDLDGRRPPTSESIRQLQAKFGKDCDTFSPLLVGQK